MESSSPPHPDREAYPGRPAAENYSVLERQLALHWIKKEHRKRRMATPQDPIRHPQEPSAQQLRRVFLCTIVGIGGLLPATTSCGIPLAAPLPDNGDSAASPSVALEIATPGSVSMHKPRSSESRLQRRSDEGSLRREYS